MKKIILFAALVLCLVAVSCSQQNIYMPEPDVWQVGNQKFDSFSEAVKSLYDEPKAVLQDRRILLLRDISGKERGEAILIPESFGDRDVCIDFNGHEYWFKEYATEFIKVEGGHEVEILNGKTVIPTSAGAGPALTITSDKALVDSHVIDDRRLKGNFLSADGTDMQLRSGAYTGNVSLEGNAKLTMLGSHILSDKVTLNGSTFLAEGATLDTDSMELNGASVFRVSGNASDVRLAATVMSAASELTVSDGSVEFSASIEKADGAEFTITGGTISNPHQIDVIVLEAIAEGGHAEDVEHVLIHAPVKHERIEPTCHTTGVEEWYSCSLCTMIFSDAACMHVIDEPVIIPIREHEISDEWVTTDWSHSHICLLCGELLDEEEHTWSEIVDDHQHCLVCGLDIDMHTHTHWYPIHPIHSDYRYDETGHWLQCSCGQKKDYAEHMFGEWYIDETGEVVLKDCLICDYTEQVTEEDADRIEVSFGTIILPDRSKTFGKMNVTRVGNTCTVTFEPYGNTNMDYTLTCWYKTGVTKVYLEEQDDRSFVFERPGHCTVYLQVSSAGGTLTKSTQV